MLNFFVKYSDQIKMYTKLFAALKFTIALIVYYCSDYFFGIDNPVKEAVEKMFYDTLNCVPKKD